MRIAFATFLAKHARPGEAIAQFAAAGSVPDQTRSDLVQLLVSANAFQEAFTIWNNESGLPSRQIPTVYDGGFEGLLSFDESGFGWRVSRSSQAVKPAVDVNQHHSGSKSLLIEFLGDSGPESPLVSQLIPVEPSRRYQINFAARTEDIVTGGLPFATVDDAAGERKRLGESPLLRQGTTDWQVVSFTFQTAPVTEAVVLSIKRKNCDTSPCPIFGSLWLDSFSIGEMK
jgi:hypothetical protein